MSTIKEIVNTMQTITNDTTDQWIAASDFVIAELASSEAMLKEECEVLRDQLAGAIVENVSLRILWHREFLARVHAEATLRRARQRRAA
jgi:hypothetical protein